jgi:hypothetical protein
MMCIPNEVLRDFPAIEFEKNRGIVSFFRISGIVFILPTAGLVEQATIDPCVDTGRRMGSTKGTGVNVRRSLPTLSTDSLC